MKYLLLIICGISLLSCGEKQRNSEHNLSPTPTLDWLIGNWERTNDEEESQTHETWKKISDEEYLGISWTIENNDTVFKENLRVAKIKNQWNLEVTGVNEAPILFPITEFSKYSFISENEQNEFPKKIVYTQEDQNLKAVISDRENEITFLFERLAKE